MTYVTRRKRVGRAVQEARAARRRARRMAVAAAPVPSSAAAPSCLEKERQQLQQLQEEEPLERIQGAAASQSVPLPPAFSPPPPPPLPVPLPSPSARARRPSAPPSLFGPASTPAAPPDAPGVARNEELAAAAARLAVPAEELLATPGGKWPVERGGGARAALRRERDNGSVEYKLKLVGKTALRMERLVSQMRFRVGEGGGEAVYRVGVTDDGRPVGIPPAEMAESVRTLAAMASELDCRVLATRVCEGERGEGFLWAQFAVRRAGAEYEHARCGVLGDAESGKTTLAGVLTSGQLCNGRGAARLGALRHRHEIQSGRSSSITHHVVAFDADGRARTAGDSSSFRFGGWADVVRGATRVVTLTDLAGGERYLRSAVSFLAAYGPDLALCLVSALDGVTEVTRQHADAAAALGVPLVPVLTKIDAAPPGRVADVRAQLRDACPGAKEVVELSLVTGQGLDQVKGALLHAPLRPADRARPALFRVDGAADVDGAGTVAAGTVVAGSVAEGQRLLAGPFRGSEFRPVAVTGVHIHHLPCGGGAFAGHVATLALAGAAAAELRRGMLLVDPRAEPRAVWEVTVALDGGGGGGGGGGSEWPRVGQQAMLHAGAVCQTARAVALLGGGSVRFRFCHRAEAVERGARAVLREGRALRGAGRIE